MKEKKEPHEGERLVLLIRRSSMKSQDVAKAIGIDCGAFYAVCFVLTGNIRQVNN